MKKIIDVLRRKSNTYIQNGLDDFLNQTGVGLKLSQECIEHINSRGIYGPYQYLDTSK